MFKKMYLISEAKTKEMQGFFVYKKNSSKSKLFRTREEATVYAEKRNFKIK